MQIFLALTEFEARALYVFLAAHIAATPSHLRGPIPQIIEGISSAIAESGPTGWCDTCGRLTYGETRVVCRVPQPDGSLCPGTLVPGRKPS